MNKPVLSAGVLGGVLGAVFAFGLLRTFPAAPPTAPAPPPAPTNEGRQYADDLIAKLKSGKTEEFLAGVRSAFPQDEDQFNQQVRLPLLKSRSEFAKAYGQSVDFEFVRETSIGPNLVRFAYLERFPGGCVVWYIVLYRSPNGWQVLAFNHPPLDRAFDLLH